MQGTHTAMKSGMLAAEAVFNALASNPEPEPGSQALEVPEYEDALMSSWVAKELKVVRNSHSAFKGPLGLLGGLIHAGFSGFISQGMEPWTFKNQITDSARTLPASECTPIEYPKPDGVLSFDLLTNLQRSGRTLSENPCM